MKTLSFVLLASLISTSAFAGYPYGCIGLNEKKQEVTIEISFESDEKATVIDMEGTEVTLDLEGVSKKGKVYADYEYDGYGGFIEMILPKSFDISGPNPAQEFRVRYTQEVFSELGHVYTTTFTGECELSDN